MSAQKTPRSVTLDAIWYESDSGRLANLSIQRADPNKRWGNEAVVTFNRYYITTRLRMLRCLALQSAFLARDGQVLK